MGVAAFAIGLWLSQDALGRLAWQRYQQPTLALMLVRRDVDLALQLGSYYFGGGAYDLARAERAYQKALAARPGVLWGHYQLGRIYFARGEFDSALAEISRELAANPENLRSLYVRGLIRGYRGELADAEEDFRRFTAWAPKEWAGYNDLAWILSRRGNYLDAEAVARTALAKVPDGAVNPWLWNRLGVALLNREEYPQARAAFGRAATLAGKLTAQEWRRAYPGNNPGDAADGLARFRAAISENSRRAALGRD